MEKHDYGWDPKIVDDDGRADILGRPQSMNNENALIDDCGAPRTSPPTVYPLRKPLDHRGPLSIDVSDAIYFITIAAAERGTSVLTDKAETILDAARFYQTHGKWFLYLFLIMPDHIHMLVHVPTISVDASVGADVPGRPQSMPNENALIDDCGAPRTSPPTVRGLAKTVGDFKSYLTKRYDIAFQRDFFDTRIRDAAHFAEKWKYICNNPVAKGLVAAPREWPYSIAFERTTGAERKHR